MTENDQTQFARQEGENSFALDSEKDNSADSSSVEETSTEDTQSQGGDGNSQGENNKEIPFNDHPAWKEREKKWEDRFNEQETRHQNDLKTIREEFSGARKDNAEQTQIPTWFGGTKEQWDDYRKYENQRLKEAEERAVTNLKAEKKAEDDAVAEATAYMQSELAALENNKELNPTGAKIDPNKLLKFVLDNDLVDSKGKWNYRAGFRMMQTQQTSAKPDTTQRKIIAGATTSESKPEKKPAPYKTSADFRKNKPW